MKILLISVNREKHPYPVQPLGAAYIAGALKAKKHDVKVLDLCFIDNYKAVLSDCLKEFCPDITGFSIRNIDNTAYPNTKYYLPYIKEVVDFCKENSESRIIVGGSGFSVMPGAVLRYLGLDTGIVGEGEQALCELVDRIEQNDSIRDIEGVVCLVNHDRFENDLDEKRVEFDRFLPDRDCLNLGQYMENGSITNVQTKRGCRFKCSYCTYPLIEGNKIRLRSPEAVVTEVEMLQKKAGVDYFYFIDSVFNFPVQHAAQICKEITRRKLKISWTAFFHPKFITAELVALLVKAGCSGVELGFDSASDTMLENLDKRFTVRDIMTSHSLCKKAGLNTCCYLLLGGPGENRHTIEETFGVIEELSPTAVIIQGGIRIYPGTALERTAAAEGYECDDYLVPRFYISKELKNDLVNIIREPISRHPNILYEGVNEDIPLETLRKMRELGVKGPLWELM
ncbi:lipid biosynthesis B12-binding/radical SAM protein [Acidobacteriota bacterium]